MFVWNLEMSYSRGNTVPPGVLNDFSHLIGLHKLVRKIHVFFFITEEENKAHDELWYSNCEDQIKSTLLTSRLKYTRWSFWPIGPKNWQIFHGQNSKYSCSVVPGCYHNYIHFWTFLNWLQSGKPEDIKPQTGWLACMWYAGLRALARSRILSCVAIIAIASCLQSTANSGLCSYISFQCLGYGFFWGLELSVCISWWQTSMTSCITSDVDIILLT